MKMGLTLIELLVVVAVVGILVILLFPAIRAIKEEARKTQCRGNLSSCHVHVITYGFDNRGQIPDSYSGSPGTVRNPTVNFFPVLEGVKEIWT